ncbi:MAG TPA: hypothetical protein VLI04_20355 [Nocardioidaceae bacterium]|nr:hypothetical protein [Nocardioidaceae bacterium]
MNDDEHLGEAEQWLRDRLRNADPARRDTPADSWLDDLVEETMSTNPESPGRKRWVPLAAAAAVFAVAAGSAAFALLGGDDEPAPRALTTTELTVAGDDITQMCMAVTADSIRAADQALEGTATEVTDGRVVITVDNWFKGGDTDLVALTPADPDLVALVGAIEFVEGEKYLIAAGDGQVSSCGLTGVYEPTLAALYAEAFPG